ncbi:hypothetical protein TruAng_005296 [Truncatella angustata]|nr:hypothetical protein TruAng_005296 [Truncatella angustata]
MLYRLDAYEEDHNFGQDRVVVIHPNPANDAPITPGTICTHCYVEPANFDHMAMMLQGTVVFRTTQRGVLFTDQESLKQGRLLLCDFENYGQLKASSRVWLLWSPMVYAYIFGLGWYGDNVIRDYKDADSDWEANAP